MELNMDIIPYGLVWLICRWGWKACRYEAKMLYTEFSVASFKNNTPVKQKQNLYSCVIT